MGQAYDGEIPLEGEISMKRLVAFILLLVVIYAVYVDLSKGTLPIVVETTTAVETEEKTIQFFEKEVRSGDTVLSIIENQLDSGVSVPIQQVTEDFKQLNEGIPAEKIQIGKTYKFPNYQPVEETID